MRIISLAGKNMKVCWRLLIKLFLSGFRLPSRMLLDISLRAFFCTHQFLGAIGKD